MEIKTTTTLIQRNNISNTEDNVITREIKTLQGK
jgi:hypothetical protein